MADMNPTCDFTPRGPDTPSDYIPGLYTLGATYDVLNGKYADSKSALQQVIDWDKTQTRVQAFGGKTYSIPDVVNYTTNTTSDYRASYGKSVTEYTKSLSIHAGFEASFPGFSASASADYSESQRENLSNAFTRITYAVTHYNLSLPPLAQIRSLLKPWFVTDLDHRDPIELYREYGTHILRSLTIGGRALFLYSTDSRAYSSTMSMEAAAKISASYLVASGSMELTAAQKQAMDSFNESSQTAVVTKGGDPRYGNEEFLKNVEAWAASIVDYPEFVEFGSTPTFSGLWELASTEARRDQLQRAYAQYVQLYAADLELPGPFLRARISSDVNDAKNAYLSVNNNAGHVTMNFPNNRSGEWYLISGGLGSYRPLIAAEMVPGALATVKWEEAFVGPYYGDVTRFWRAIPPTPDYIALGCVGMTGKTASAIPSQPPADLASRFRAVHKRAITAATQGLTLIYRSDGNKAMFGVDSRYFYADTQLPPKQDCFRLDPKNVVEEFTM